MDAALYLERIGVDPPRDAGGEVLTALHRAHLHSVPFENLDVHFGRSIELSLGTLFEKIVQRRRGGFCYELNGLFAWLLQELGFEVRLLSARVHGEAGLGPEFDHMLLLVRAEDEWLADVGFGDSFLEPLPFRNGSSAGEDGFRVWERDGSWELLRRGADDEWCAQYRFTTTPRRLEDFDAMCRWQSTSPDSRFTQKSVCSRATPEGRVTLSNGSLLYTSREGRQQRRITDEAECRELLQEHFGIRIAEGVDFSALVRPRP